MLYRIDPEKLKAALIEAGRGLSDNLGARGLYITKAVDTMLSGTLIPEWAEAVSGPPKKKEKGVGYPAEFEAFWEAYPSRCGVKSGKAVAYRAWKKIAKEQGILDRILENLTWQRNTEQWQEADGKYIPMATTYLNQRRFEDEHPTAVQANTPKPADKMDWENFK